MFEDLERRYRITMPASSRTLIAGVDEAGRGPLAGPVSVGIAVFAPEFFDAPVPEDLAALDDSKNLKPAVREELYDAVRRHALFAAVVHVSSRMIDRVRINPAIEFAIRRALVRACCAGVGPNVVLVDGNYKLATVRSAFPGMHFESVVKGDSRVFSIAAASILAKVTRDRRMIQYDRLFPGYGLADHKGYGTKRHRERIAGAGPSPIHRRSYRW